MSSHVENQPMKVSLQIVNKRKRNITPISNQSQLFVEEEITTNLRKDEIDTATDIIISIEKIINLKDQGCLFAEAGDFRKALNLFNTALRGSSITADDKDSKNKFIISTLYELKAQAYLELDYILQAVQDAKNSIKFSPQWATAHLTLARCQREIGEVGLSMESYLIAQNLVSQKLDYPLDSDIEVVITQEIEELKIIIINLDKKREIYKQKVDNSSTPAELEANKCIYNLSARIV